MQHHRKNSPATIKSVIAWLKHKEHRNEEFSFLGRNIEGCIAGLFWPIYMFLVVGAYEEQGLAASLGLVASTAMVYVAGRIFDNRHSFKIYKFGVFSTSIMWIVRGFVRTFTQLVFVEVIISSLSPFYWVTYDSLLYERARDEDEQVLTFMVSRMFMVSLAMFIALAFVALTATFAWRFWGMWILASLAVLFTSFMWEKKKDE